MELERKYNQIVNKKKIQRIKQKLGLKTQIRRKRKDLALILGTLEQMPKQNNAIMHSDKNIAFPILNLFGCKSSFKNICFSYSVRQVLE